jgi:uncharacterized protein (DUF362 family)
MGSDPQYHVRATQCDYLADDEAVYQALRRATDPLEESWQRLAAAKRVGIKFNMDKPTDRWVFHEGQLQQLVSAKVARAFLRLLRERTDAELFCVDVSFYAMYMGTDPQVTGTVMPLLREFGVEYIDGTKPPYKMCQVPGGGGMFRQYLMPQAAVEADEFVSVAKMKNHGFMGITLALKNLFGLMPAEPQWHTRTYFHHLVRMPYMLADLGRIFDPVLNVVDGLVGQAGQEWGNGLDQGPARVGNTLVAGNQVIATDACAAHLMGHDPQSDWLTPPFHRDRNALLVAAEGGFGTVDLEQIDFESESEGPVNEFYSNHTDSLDIVASWRRTTCEQALHYRDNRDWFIQRYAGKYVLLQEGEVRWHHEVSDLKESRRKLSGDKPEQAMWLKYVDPEEAEGEHFEVYERALASFEDDLSQAAG